MIQKTDHGRLKVIILWCTRKKLPFSKIDFTLVINNFHQYCYYFI